MNRAARVQAPADDVIERGAPGILTLCNANTTLGYCRYTPDGEVEYIFVHPQFRRRGLARRMLDRVRAETGQRPRFQPPISPLGHQLRQAYEDRHSD